MRPKIETLGYWNDVNLTTTNKKTIELFFNNMRSFTHYLSTLKIQNTEDYILEKQIFSTLIFFEEWLDRAINVLLNRLKIIDNFTSSERKRKKNA